MPTNDDDLKRDLTDAAGRDLPGEEFDEAVMDSIRGGGGERAISADLPDSRRRRFVGLAAAAVLGGLLVWGIAGGFLARSGGPGEAEEEAAGPGVKLPPAETSVPFPRPLKIVVTKDEEIHVVGKQVDFDGLRGYLVEATRGTHTDASNPSSREVVIRADRRVRWRAIQWVMQSCANPDIRINRIYWAVSGAEEKRVLPVFLPVDRGLERLDGRDGGGAVGVGGGAGGAFGGRGSTRLREEVIEENPEDGPPDHISDAPFDGPERARIAVRLARAEGESESRVKLLDHWIGEGEAGFALLEKQVAQILRSARRLPAEVDGGAEVPFEDVVRVVDMLRKLKVREITFTGAPPPGRGR